MRPVQSRLNGSQSWLSRADKIKRCRAHECPTRMVRTTNTLGFQELHGRQEIYHLARLKDRGEAQMTPPFFTSPSSREGKRMKGRGENISSNTPHPNHFKSLNIPLPFLRRKSETLGVRLNMLPHQQSQERLENSFLTPQIPQSPSPIMTRIIDEGERGKDQT